MSKLTKISYLFIFLTILLVGTADLGPPFLSVLFAYLTLSQLRFKKYPVLAVLVFIVLVIGIFYSFVFFLREALEALPRVTETAIPIIAQALNIVKRHLDTIPFCVLSDYGDSCFRYPRQGFECFP